MFFITLHKPNRGQIDEVMVRGDMVLEITTRRFTKKEEQYIPIPSDPPREPGEIMGTWVLVDRLGWTPCTETPTEVREAIVVAEVAYLTRLAAAKAT